MFRVTCNATTIPLEERRQLNSGITLSKSSQNKEETSGTIPRPPHFPPRRKQTQKHKIYISIYYVKTNYHGNDKHHTKINFNGKKLYKYKTSLSY